MEFKSVYIIIVTYNGLKWINKCITSVLNQDYKDCKILVVDNNSTDGTIQFIKTNFPEVILIEEKKNSGFGAANNIGFKYAMTRDAKFVFLLNQDAYLHADTIGNLVRVSIKNPDYALISPLQLNGEGSGFDYSFNHLIGSITPNINFDFYTNNKKELYSTNGYLMAAMWLIPIKTLSIIGGFDPIFFHYGEDTDYINRIKYFGYKIGICPYSTGFHDRKRKMIEITSYSLFITYLSQIKNINNSGIALVRTYFKYNYLFLKRIFSGKIDFSYYFKLTTLLPKVMRNRSLSKEKNQTFL